MPITLSLSGKVALITGGSRGIGAAAVRMFVAAGARVMFNYEKSKARSERLVKEMGKKNCAAIHCNLSGTGTAQELVEATVNAMAQHRSYQSRQRVRADQAFGCKDEESKEIGSGCRAHRG